MTTYTHYNFVDKDPVFDRLWSIIDGHGLTLQQVADASGMTYQTLWGWRYGKTRYAYYSSVMRVVIGLRQWDFKLIDEKLTPRGKFKVISGKRAA
jgi:transcriptional regulator with XRE-family HTH domain